MFSTFSGYAMAKIRGMEMNGLCRSGLIPLAFGFCPKPGVTEILQYEDRAPLLCAAFDEVRRMQKIAEATGALPKDGNCWAVDPSIEAIILDQIESFMLITYRDDADEDWYEGPSYTPTDWLNGFSNY